MASQRPPSGMGRPVSRSGSVVPGTGKPPTAIRPPPTAIRVGTGVKRLERGYTEGEGESITSHCTSVMILYQSSAPPYDVTLVPF